MGASVVAINLENNHQELVKALTGQEVVVSSLVPFTTGPEIALATAAKEAGVKRFVPSAFGPSCPPHGVMLLREFVSHSTIYLSVDFSSDNFIERNHHQPRQENLPALHHHRRWFVVPGFSPASPIWQD